MIDDDGNYGVGGVRVYGYAAACKRVARAPIRGSCVRVCVPVRACACVLATVVNNALCILIVGGRHTYARLCVECSPV